MPKAFCRRSVYSRHKHTDANRGHVITFKSEQALVKLAVRRNASTAVSWLQASRALVSSAASQNSLQLLRLYMLMPASSASRTSSGLRLAAFRRLPALGLFLPVGSHHAGKVLDVRQQLTS